MKSLFCGVAAIGFGAAQAALAGGLGGFVFEGDLGWQHVARGGSGLNESGAPFAEAGNYSGVALSARFGGQVGNGIHLTFGAALTESLVDDTTDGAPTDDTLARHGQVSLQAGGIAPLGYLGGFAVAGEVKYAGNEQAQDTGFSAFGAEAAWQGGAWLAGVQIGRIDSERSANPEVLDNAAFARLHGTYFLNDGRTGIGGWIGIAEGEQDVDQPNADPVDLWTVGLSAEHALRRRVSLFGTIDFTQNSELSSGGGRDIVNDTVFTLGARWTFGAEGPEQASRVLAPRLPDFGRWVGNVSAVD